MESILNWFVKTFDPAMRRTWEERQLEKATEIVARQLNLELVKAKPVRGVKAELVLSLNGLSVCGVNSSRTTGVPARVILREVESRVRAMTRGIDWEARCD